jgi:hypothetical protein
MDADLRKKELAGTKSNQDLSRNCAAPLTAYYAQMENNYSPHGRVMPCMIPREGKKRPAEIRQEAVRVAQTSELTRKQVAADFGIGFSH